MMTMTPIMHIDKPDELCHTEQSSSGPGVLDEDVKQLRAEKDNAIPQLGCYGYWVMNGGK